MSASVNLYPTFEQAIHSELPFRQHLRFLRIEVTAVSLGQRIEVHHMAPYGQVLKPTYRHTTAVFLLAGRELHPRMVRAMGKLLGHPEILVETSPGGSAGPQDFNLVFQP
ncbi:hypothetical protein [Deinococcus cellulosilyticus]|uniref:Uncharacterized protein n=1 Tax=Deinococcus cellulosilyticus (strain DSM 18568 / NBRC 106333 / KACC 11606 / 5516J-15) TaxID=1223518 RepID=A0A511NAM3_DEIC1|nr:hypothetical protein [Deinococcus cellulosilyticus]GEM49885.1 hypothetical protein DC3_55200 [Deinococcus cellulosilyticus NBRC 106333 = KACC 11606]